MWKVLADMTPQQLVDLVDWRYLRDTLTPEAALAMLEEQLPGRAEREARLHEEGYPAYTTSAGWLGYDDDKLVRLCREAVAAGWDAIKLKVGGDLADDVRRCALAREVIGPGRRLMIDANQTLGAADAVRWIGSARSRTTSGGSRSRRVRTTSSRTPRSRAPSPPSAWPPASTRTTR